jgi:putative glycerol-1-phosphate prenyltransferase
MQQIYKDILQAKTEQRKLLAILLDPDKLEVNSIKALVSKINTSPASHVFVGGSSVANHQTEYIVTEIKKYTTLPVILFPGDSNQVTNTADGLLFLTLLSGRNPEYLIEQHIKAVPLLQKSNLEIIPTGYILINGGIETAVQKVSKTTPIERDNIQLAIHTALAGQYSGKQLIYLEAGSGAKSPVLTKMISEVSKSLNIPLIVGGGIRTNTQIQDAYNAGANIVVIGTAIEKNDAFLENIH